MAVSALRLQNLDYKKKKTILLNKWGNFLYNSLFLMQNCYNNFSEVPDVIWADAVFFSFSRYPGCMYPAQPSRESHNLIKSWWFDFRSWWIPMFRW